MKNFLKTATLTMTLLLPAATMAQDFCEGPAGGLNFSERIPTVSSGEPIFCPIAGREFHFDPSTERAKVRTFAAADGKAVDTNIVVSNFSDLDEIQGLETLGFTDSDLSPCAKSSTLKRASVVAGWFVEGTLNDKRLAMTIVAGSNGISWLQVNNGVSESKAVTYYQGVPCLPLSSAGKVTMSGATGKELFTTSLRPTSVAVPLSAVKDLHGHLPSTCSRCIKANSTDNDVVAADNEPVGYHGHDPATCSSCKFERRQDEREQARGVSGKKDVP